MACDHDEATKCSECPFPVGGYAPLTLTNVPAYEAGRLTMTMRQQVLEGTLNDRPISYDMALNGDVWVTYDKRTVVLRAADIMRAVVSHLIDARLAPDSSRVG